jgi:hypothetical protein
MDSATGFTWSKKRGWGDGGLKKSVIGMIL